MKSGTSDPNNLKTILQNKDSNPNQGEYKEEAFAKWENVFEDKTMQVYVEINNILDSNSKCNFL